MIGRMTSKRRWQSDNETCQRTGVGDLKVTKEVSRKRKRIPVPRGAGYAARSMWTLFQGYLILRGLEVLAFMLRLHA